MNEKQTHQTKLEGEEGRAYARSNLVQIAVDHVNWRVLHRNPRTGEYWKEYFPQSEMHGGGPPVFVKISEEEAKREFNLK